MNNLNIKEELLADSAVTLVSVSVGEKLSGKKPFEMVKILANSIYAILYNIMKKRYPSNPDQMLKHVAMLGVQSILSEAAGYTITNLDTISQNEAETVVKRILKGGIMKAVYDYVGRLIYDNGSQLFSEVKN